MKASTLIFAATALAAFHVAGCQTTPEPSPGTEWKRHIAPATPPAEDIPSEPLSDSPSTAPTTSAFASEVGGVLDIDGVALPTFQPGEADAMQTIVVGQAPPRQHTVGRGETLYAIARTYLGDGRRWRDVVAANPGLDPAGLVVGQTLVVP